MSNKYDLAVLGSGPGGYVAALKAAQLGLSVCLIEKEALGGVCLNWGCIPTKTLLKTVHLLDEIKRAEQLAIDIDKGSLSVDFTRLQKRKADIVAKLVKGIDFLLKKNKVDVIYGKGVFADKNNIKVGEQIVTFDRCIIASGSVPQELPAIRFDESAGILSNRGILSLETVPGELLIIGGGVIGCEFADVFSGLGSKITIIELADQLLPGEDKDIVQVLTQEFKRKGINVHIGISVKSVDRSVDGRFEITLSDGNKLNADKILLSVGRKPNVTDFGLDVLGLNIEKGRISVDATMRTNIDNIYAIGDVVGKYALAHVAQHQAIVAAKNIAGKKAEMDYTAVPRCVYTNPEIAGVGLSQKQAEDMGIGIKIGKFSFLASGKAVIEASTKGFVKIIARADDDTLLGVSVCGPCATEIIHESGVALACGLKAARFGDIIHAHPTVSESVMEAAQDADKQSVHIAG